MSHFLLCGVSMTALSHIQHAQLSAFSFISEGGRVSQREITSWCWEFISDYTPSCGSHGEEEQNWYRRSDACTCPILGMLQLSQELSDI